MQYDQFSLLDSGGWTGCGSTPGCVFPFKYLGQEYNTCVYFDQEQPWCSSEVDQEGNHIGEKIPCSQSELNHCDVHLEGNLFYCICV